MWASPLIFTFLFLLTLFSSGGSLSSLISNVDKGIELNCKIKKKRKEAFWVTDKSFQTLKTVLISMNGKVNIFSWLTLGSSYYFVLEGGGHPLPFILCWRRLIPPAFSLKTMRFSKENPLPHSFPIKQWITAAPKSKDLHVSFNL